MWRFEKSMAVFDRIFYYSWRKFQNKSVKISDVLPLSLLLLFSRSRQKFKRNLIKITLKEIVLENCLFSSCLFASLFLVSLPIPLTLFHFLIFDFYLSSFPLSISVSSTYFCLSPCFHFLSTLSFPFNSLKS